MAQTPCRHRSHQFHVLRCSLSHRERRLWSDRWNDRYFPEMLRGKNRDLLIGGQVRVLVGHHDDKTLGASAPYEAAVIGVCASGNHVALFVESHSNGLETGFLASAGAAGGVYGVCSRAVVRLHKVNIIMR